MNFRVCFKCKSMTWFDIVFTFFKIKTPKINPLPNDYLKYNIENGDYLIDFRPEIYCYNTNGNLRHKIFVQSDDFIDGKVLEDFYFKHPEIMEFALLKKDFIRKKKIKIEKDMTISCSLFHNEKLNKFFYCCDATPEALREHLLNYMKKIEELMQPSEMCKYCFEHIVFQGDEI